MEDELVFKTFFNDLISLLIDVSVPLPGNSGRAEKNKSKTDPEVIVSRLRARLETIAVGSHCHLREKLWSEYYSNHLNRPDVSLFLDCILDGSFSRLTCRSRHFPNTPTTPDGKFYPVRLVEVIALQSPQLQGLSLILPSQWRLLNAEESGASFGKSFQSLRNLTELGINWNSPEGMATFFSHLGIACPQLKLLILGDQVNFGRKERLALVLGKYSELLPHYLMKKTNEDHEKNILCSLQFADENVTPLCRSLESLTILGGSQGKRGRNYVEDDEVEECYCVINIPSMVFLLRHMPQLQKMEMKRYDYHPGCRHGCDRISNCCLALNLLLKASQSNNPVRVSEISWRDGDGHSSGDSVSFQWTINSPPRTLNLSELTGHKTGCVNLVSQKEMEAVVSFCYRLKVVHFVQIKTTPSDTLWSRDLHSFLVNNLLQVETVILDQISVDYRKVVLSLLGRQLKKLEVGNCEDFQLDELVSLIGLEELELKFDAILMKSIGLTLDKVHQFITHLPSLQKLTIPDGLLQPEQLATALESSQINLLPEHFEDDSHPDRVPLTN